LFCRGFGILVSLVNFWYFNFFCNKFLLLLFLAHFFLFCVLPPCLLPWLAFFLSTYFSFFFVSFLRFFVRDITSHQSDQTRSVLKPFFLYFLKYFLSFPIETHKQTDKIIWLLKHQSENNSFRSFSILSLTRFLRVIGALLLAFSTRSLLAWFTLSFGYVTEPRVRTWCLRCSLFFFEGVLCLFSVGTMTFLVMSCIFWGYLDMVQRVCMYQFLFAFYWVFSFGTNLFWGFCNFSL